MARIIVHIITVTKQRAKYSSASARISGRAGPPDPELVALVEREVKAWIAQPWTDAEDRGFEILTQRLLEALERVSMRRHG
jgi:hypothetical protein